MTIARHLKRVSLALVTIGSIGAAQFASAEGTLATTQITNSASVTYSVEGLPQAPVPSPIVNITVDRRIRFTVAGPANGLSVTPGEQDVVAAFTITNFTNSAQDFGFQAINEAINTTFDGRTDDSDAPGLSAFVDAGVIGTYEQSTDIATFVDDLAADATVNIIVVADYPLTATNGQVANVLLTVRATTNSSNGVTSEIESATNAQEGDPDVVIADTDRNNSESDQGQFYVTSAALTVAKITSVISDPFNLVSPNAKAIPGAVVQYEITVTNNGASTATGVTLNDAIPADTTFVSSSITVGGTDVPDGGNTVGPPVTAIDIELGDMAAGDDVTVTFQVTIDE